MLSTVIQQYNEDCGILLKRALVGKTLSCFGADGNGQYGHHAFARHFTVLNVHTTVYSDVDETLFGKATIALLGYSSSDHGHVATDMNLKISVNEALKTEYIEPDCWSWSPLEEQGAFYFSIDFNPEILINGKP